MKNKERASYKKYRLNIIFNKIIPKRTKKIKKQEFKAKYSRSTDAPMHIAIVLDGIVEDIIHCDDRLGILLLSSPDFIEINKDIPIGIDWLYNKETNEFYKKEF